MLLIRPALAVVILLTSCAATAPAQGPAAPAKNKGSQEAPLPKLSELQNPAEIKEFEPPVEIVKANGFMDGGTTYVVLRDAKKRLMILCVSQNAFEETVPGNTLFLNAAHSDEPTARLPFSENETRLVIASLESAIKAHLTDEERDALLDMGDPGEQRMHESVAVPKNERWSANEWTLTFAFDALRRLQSRASHDVVSADGTTKPAWHAAWAAEMAEKRAEEERERKANELFESFYPEAARACFHSPAVRTGPDFVGAAKKEGQRIAEIVGDPVRVATISCQALGTLDDSWTSFDARTYTAMAAAHTVDADAFLAALRELHDNPSALLGAARLFFAEDFADKLPAPERDQWTVELARTVVNSDRDGEKPAVIGKLGVVRTSEATALLWQIAKGETGTSKLSKEEWSQEPSVRPTAFLMLAQQGDANVREAIAPLLLGAEGADKAAYELSLAFLGDDAAIKGEHFQIPSYTIGLGALRAIEKHPSAHTLDILFSAGFEHPWAAVTNECLLTAQRITGQTWVEAGNRRQVRFYAEDAQKWWADNKSEFLAKLGAPTP
jgi:hypothetical protein